MCAGTRCQSGQKTRDDMRRIAVENRPSLADVQAGWPDLSWKRMPFLVALKLCNVS